LISEILPILTLLSGLSQRTWDFFSDFADSVLAQPLATKHLGRFLQFGQFCFCSASCQYAFGSVLEILPILLLLSVGLNALGSISKILPILFLLSVWSQSTWVAFSNYADSVFVQHFAPRTFIKLLLMSDIKPISLRISELPHQSNHLHQTNHSSSSLLLHTIIGAWIHSFSPI